MSSLEASAEPSLVDLHCHFVPGVDDGAQTLDDALHYLREFAGVGIRHVVTTPHLSAEKANGKRRAEIEQSFAELRERVAAELGEMRLSLSYEVRLDDPDADLSDRRLGLEDGGRLLVEFPMLMLPAYPEHMLGTALRQDWVPVLAHPERYAGIEHGYSWIERWRSLGAVMAVNAGSLWGEYGPEAERVARCMLERGQADIIASDHHCRPRRSTHVRAAWDLLCEAGHAIEARRLMQDNPAAILRGEPVRAVPPVDLLGWFGRLKRRMWSGHR